jgi:predicted phage terminase large subunit-like protein
MAMFGLRLGDVPQALYTTTPKPIPLLKDLIARDDCVMTRGSTYENKSNLAPSFFSQIAQYEGTVIGRQEIYAEVIDMEEFGILRRSWFDLFPAADKLPAFEYIVQSYDTAFSLRDDNDPTACVTLGVYHCPIKKMFRIMLLDAWDEQVLYPDLRERAQKDYNVKFGEVDRSRCVDLVLIEDKAAGSPLATELQRAGVPVRRYNPGRADKLQRLHAVSHIVKDGLVVIPESKKQVGKPVTWAEGFLNQVCAFRGEGTVKHDDYVDAFTQALALLRDQTWIALKSDYEPDEEEVEPEKRSNPYAA